MINFGIVTLVHQYNINDIFKIYRSIIEASVLTSKVKYHWKIIIDIRVIGVSDYYELDRLIEAEQNIDISYIFIDAKSLEEGFGWRAPSLRNLYISKASNYEYDYLYFLDSDNILHPEFGNFIDRELHGEQNIVIGCRWNNDRYLSACPGNMKCQSIDIGQVVWKASHISNLKFPDHPYDDGLAYEKYYNDFPNNFRFVDEELCYYNYIAQNKDYFLPNIDISELQDQNGDFKSIQLYQFEDNRIHINKYFNPNSIDVNCTDKVKDLEGFDLGQYAFESYIKNVLDHPYKKPIFSIFTSSFKTKEKLRRAYDSLVTQTITNWEYIIVLDSDCAKTRKIARDLSCEDPRVKVYEFTRKTLGNIGNAKFRACGLTEGDFLIELDHDDILLPQTLEWIYKASKVYPDAGFFYTHNIGMFEGDTGSVSYGGDFAYNMGTVYQTNYKDKLYSCIRQPDITPVSIRHIVGVPNHVRCWTREAYHKAGEYNPKLVVADDYELLIRTFLVTRFCHIEECGYIQYMHENNSQDHSRAHIQRMVRAIKEYYNEKIHDRFEELGVDDFIYSQNYYNIDYHEAIKSKDSHKVNYNIKFT